ncbi:MAG: hypothetical protein ABIG60_02730 [Patescibacteria group bacterium]
MDIILYLAAIILIFGFVVLIIVFIATIGAISGIAAFICIAFFSLIFSYFNKGRIITEEAV